jgi:hypothetical protein
MMLDNTNRLQDKLNTEWDTEKKAMEEYIAKLESIIQEKEEEFQKMLAEAETKMQDLMSQIPVENAQVGYMSHIGIVEEDEDKPEVEDVLKDEVEQTQNGYNIPPVMGFKRNTLC